MPQYKAAREAMIEGQLKPNKVNDPRVLDAMRSVPRDHFVPAGLKGVAYVDEDLEIAPGRYLIEPMVFGRLLCEARIKPNAAVLDIGCASGYSSAVLAKLAESVIALESDPDLAKTATRKLAELQADTVAVIEGSLVGGAPKQGPFDIIFLGGGVAELPDALMDQLAEGGRLVCVRTVRGVGKAEVHTKINGAIGIREVFDGNVPLLPGFEPQPSFQF